MCPVADDEPGDPILWDVADFIAGTGRPREGGCRLLPQRLRAIGGIRLVGTGRIVG